MSPQENILEKMNREEILNRIRELEIEKRRLNNKQLALKLTMNSLYGAMGSAYFRYFDLRIAEAVTLSGQLTIRTAEVALNRYLNKILKTDKDYVIAIDTDSLYVDMKGLVEAVNPDDPLDFLDKSCKKAIEPVFEKVYNDLFKRMNAYENRMVLEREVIADRGVWTAKKRYILNVLDDEGVRYTESEIKIKGLEAVKSSTPTFIRDKMKEAFKVILREKEADLQKFVKRTFEEFSKLPAEDVSFPRGVSEVEKWKDPTAVYKKGTPIHVRGSLIYNKLLMEGNLHTRFEYIKDGDKIKFCYLKMPNPTRENVISFPRFLPREFGLDEYIDYELQYSKTFREPLKLITNAIDWHLDKTATLKHLFNS